MHRYKHGKAKNGPKGGKDKSHKQAIAIGLSKAQKMQEGTAQKKPLARRCRFLWALPAGAPLFARPIFSTSIKVADHLSYYAQRFRRRAQWRLLPHPDGGIRS